MGQNRNSLGLRLARAVKRTFDILVGIGAGLVFLPIGLGIALAIRLDDGGPVLFRQVRVGRGGRPFKINKFRTMAVKTPNCPTASLGNPDRYITRVGRFLRKSSLDELPQLWNLILGQMSVVGPRPLIPEEGDIHELRHRWGVYAVRPGITGLAQVNGRDLVRDPEKAAMDRDYVRGFSIWLDLSILVRTVLVVLKAEGVHEGTRPGHQSQPSSPSNHRAASEPGPAPGI